MGPATNRKRLKAEHHSLPSNLIVAKAPWSKSLEVPKNILWMGQGRNRVSCDLCAGDMLKLISGTDHGNEMECSTEFPNICAGVSWQGPLQLQWNNAKEKGIVTLQGLVMRKCHLVKPCLLERQGSVRAYEFLAYSLVLVHYLFHKGMQLRDIGGTNLAVHNLDDDCPMIAFIDMHEWEKRQRQRKFLPSSGNLQKWQLQPILLP